MEKNQLRLKFYVFWLSTILAAFILGMILQKTVFSNKDDKLLINKIQSSENRGKFISPLLGIKVTPGPDGFPQYHELKNKIANAAEAAANNHQANALSIYLHDLKTGDWLGYNEDNLFNPASLLKIATLITYLHAADQDPAVLGHKIVYKPSSGATGSEFVKPNTEYTVTDLLKYMIVESDNTAKDLLKSAIDSEIENKIYDELGLRRPGGTDDLYPISPKDYSLFFRILYNATYLSRTLSDKALELLSLTAFRDGLVAPLPNTVLVAHKFGSHHLDELSPPEYELHDCGIIYHPANPYFLCVMMRGYNQTDLAKVIQSISKLVFDNAGQQ